MWLGLVLEVDTELSQLASMGLMGLMIVVVAVVISTRSFIQCFSTVTAPLTLILRMSSSTDSSINATQFAVEYDEVDDGVGKLVKKLSKGRRTVKKSEKPQRPEKLQRSLARRNVYRSTGPPSTKNSSFI